MRRSAGDGCHWFRAGRRYFTTMVCHAVTVLVGVSPVRPRPIPMYLGLGEVRRAME